jgi:MFS family permease
MPIAQSAPEERVDCAIGMSASRALVQQRIPDRHLAKALGLWEAGIAGAIAIAPVIATTIIDNVGVSTGFMLSGAALIVR